MEHNELWKRCLEVIRANVSPVEYKDWFHLIRSVGIRAVTAEQKASGVEADYVLEVLVPSLLYSEHLEEHYGQLIRAVLYHVVGKGYMMEYLSMVSRAESEQEREKENAHLEVISMDPAIIPGIPRRTAAQRERYVNPNLNPEYTFDALICGDFNKFAYQAGRDIVENPIGRSKFNPLVIYGVSGVGKTHLAQAIGHAIREKDPTVIVLYVEMNEFMDQYITAVRRGEVSGFTNYYQQVDVLIIDDIHDVQRGEGSQKKLQEIFNYLHTRGKQLIFTSAMRLIELTKVRNDLLSRLRWGVNPEISVPDEAMRLQILRHKAQRVGITDVPDGVFALIAQQVRTSVRELEGALTNIVAKSTIMRIPIDETFARAVLENFLTPIPHETLSVSRIVEIICDFYKVRPSDLQGATRKRDITEARQIAMALAKEFLDVTYAQIGADFNRNHGTVMHACKAVTNLCQSNAKIRGEVDELRRILRDLQG